MDKLIMEYLQDVIFENFPSDTLAINDLENLETKHGVVVRTDTTDLWITRKLSVMSVLGVPTVFESTTEFMILDDFGMMIWDGTSEDTVEYVEGFVNGEEPEFE